MQKSEVRAVAEAQNLPACRRKDSQGICFLGKLKFDDFLGHYLGESPGDIRDYRTDKLLGRHRGLWFHTVGQRKGIGENMLPGVVNLGPWFVAAKDSASNTVYVTNDLAIVDKPRRELVIDSVNWILGEPGPLRRGEVMTQIEMRLRHGAALSVGSISRETRPQQSTHQKQQRYKIILADKDKGLASGQFVALYHGAVCLGAGIIAETARD